MDRRVSGDLPHTRVKQLFQNNPNNNYIYLYVDFVDCRSSYEQNLTSSCNSLCQCSDVIYSPVCGSNGVKYFSPCHAGCLEQTYIAIVGEDGTNESIVSTYYWGKYPICMELWKYHPSCWHPEIICLRMAISWNEYVVFPRWVVSRSRKHTLRTSRYIMYIGMSTSYFRM